MITEEYHVLMRFYILTGNVDIKNAKYAAVDSDGELNVFSVKPYLYTETIKLSLQYWIDGDGFIDREIFITTMKSVLDNVNDMIIKL